MHGPVHQKTQGPSWFFSGSHGFETVVSAELTLYLEILSRNLPLTSVLLIQFILCHISAMDLTQFPEATCILSLLTIFILTTCNKVFLMNLLMLSCTSRVLSSSLLFWIFHVIVVISVYSIIYPPPSHTIFSCAVNSTLVLPHVRQVSCYSTVSPAQCHH